MSKPDDIAQDVWDAADSITDYISNELAASIMGTSPPPTDEDGLIKPAIARAIMAERERCAQAADTYFMRWENDGSAYWLERRMHSEEIASTIRKPA